jgi:site-specific DNA-methyltransferase (adenine-specific)
MATRPYYSAKDKRVAIYHADAMAFLRGLAADSVDLIVTDPAYSGMNQRLKLGSGKIIGRYKEAGKDGAKWFEEFHDTEENYRTFLEQCYRVMRPDRHIYLMFDSYSLLTLGPLVREVFEVKNILCWDKANIGLGHYFRRRHEFIVFASKGKRPLNCKSIPDVWKIRRIVKAAYPTQKPTELFELMLRGSATPGSLVCDPFLGSGSSAIAALKCGCKFVGCDISSRSMEFARARIEGFLKGEGDIYQPGSQVSDDAAIAQLLSS